MGVIPRNRAVKATNSTVGIKIEPSDKEFALDVFVKNELKCSED